MFHLQLQYGLRMPTSHSRPQIPVVSCSRGLETRGFSRVALWTRMRNSIRVDS